MQSVLFYSLILINVLAVLASGVSLYVGGISRPIRSLSVAFRIRTVFSMSVLLADSIILSLVLCLMLGWVVLRYPGNHWGLLDIRGIYYLSVPSVLISMFSFSRNPKWSLCSLGIGVGVSWVVFLLDYFNILVFYDLWCVRGEPMPFQW